MTISDNRNKFFAVHAHFYQPPRENPWTGEIDRQSSAWPYHNWNERIARECYIPNAYSRINDSMGRALELINNYEYFNFNFGPTLFSWLERKYPSYYARVIAAGKKSRETCGHSNAIAQVYNHLIMPLASFNDRLTQVIWGIRDYEFRFGFRPEAMWLAETAVDDDTLRLLIDHGMRYAILSPYQAQSVRPLGSEKWTDTTYGISDNTEPYIWFDRAPDVPASLNNNFAEPRPFEALAKKDGTALKNRSLAIFFYNGPLSKALAFEGALKESGALAERINACYDGGSRHDQLVSVAVDGETFGHHHKFGDMTLAHCFRHELKKHHIQAVNFSTYLDTHPPKKEALIKKGPDGEGTAWSCAHGVRRWKGGCECGKEDNASLNWRLPLRAALNALRDTAAEIYLAESAGLLKDPWRARNAYINLLLEPGSGPRKTFFAEQAARPLTEEEKKKILLLLEMEKNTLFMFTSCGWFFSDISRIETLQNLKYAAKAIETLELLGFKDAQRRFLSLLEMAQSNVKDFENGARLYARFAGGSAPGPEKTAALRLLELFLRPGYSRKTSLSFTHETYGSAVFGELRCRWGRVSSYSDVTDKKTGLAFIFLRHNGEFPVFFFPEALSPGDSLEPLFKSGDLAAAERAITEKYAAARVGFEDLTHDEKSAFLELIVAEIKEKHSPHLLKVLEDLLYIFEKNPGTPLTVFETLKRSLNTYAYEALGVLFEEVLRDITGTAVKRLYSLSKRLSAIKTDFEFSPAPSLSAACSISALEKALKDPSSKNLEELLLLLKTARFLRAGELLFHLQNGLSGIFIEAKTDSRWAPLASQLKELYENSELVIERFNFRLEELQASGERKVDSR
ncbi:MAG: hypothetical protein A2X34_00235 [Elusimicrobia bacterium GWC2_51_8]|nr:MAG: hypothetical protein A2X33_06805 [Elusimicrobia bacterium GWA2_51_34]OGR57679.1 MAG: hypothetical protein A2X34_00235 [Elusimicrobia bacterium GWC2_51_8]HAF95436.1 hypothetical protein [Elusimicrobiota bacterium]HCE98098.1 hypothetical protein [Elusimicrobiota bacterium]